MRQISVFRPRQRVLQLGRKTAVMGVVNITPDSFYDGGKFLSTDRAVERGLALVEQGADLIDLGGESSRPGAEPVSTCEELERVLPVLTAIRPQVTVPISVDTTKSEVAEKALQAGADIINDISAFRFDPQLPHVVAKWEAGIILMHMRGNPRNMQKLPPSGSILSEIRQDLRNAVETAFQHNIPGDKIALDPGIGFGKTLEDNLKILNRLRFLEGFTLPILVGVSRKSFLGAILELPVQRRLLGTLASVAIAITRGAHMVRVHDVAEVLEVVRVTDSILAEGKVT